MERRPKELKLSGETFLVLMALWLRDSLLLVLLGDIDRARNWLVLSDTDNRDLRIRSYGSADGRIEALEEELATLMVPALIGVVVVDVG
jgi:hypothetical protein